VGRAVDSSAELPLEKNMNTKSACIAAALAATLLSLPSAHAQGVQQACAGDIQAFCASVPQGDGAVARCLRENQPKLTAACQAGMGRMASLMQEVARVCEDDLHRHCAGATPGAAKDCLRTNFRELSLACKRELLEAKQAM
jgi:Cysteine rich repeat